MHRLAIVLALTLIVSTVISPATPATAQTGSGCPPGKAPEFVFGFAALKSRLGDWMGDPVTCEYPDPNGTGDVHQRTTKGLAFWRKSTNVSTFTNGEEHWGLVDGTLVYWTGVAIDPPYGATEGHDHPCVAAGSCAPVVAQQAPEPALAPVVATPAPTPPPTPAPLSEADVAERLRLSTVLIEVDLDGNGSTDGFGSGSRIPEGIVTNHHVIEGARLITLKAADGRRGTASVLRSDSRRDLALLTDPLGLPQLALSPSQQQRVGDPILVMGYPQADVLGTGTATLTRGIISAIRPDIPGLQGVLHLQTDAATNPGNSGGPWVNMRGGLIGVHRAKLRESQGINIAVASDEVQGFLTGPAAVVPSPVATSRPAPPAQPQPTAAPTPSAQKREMIAAADWLDAVVARGGTANQANDHRTLFSLYEQVRARAHPPQTNALYDAARDLLSAAGRRAKLIDDYPYIEIDGRTYNVLTNPSAYNVWVAAVNLETSKVDTALSQYQTAWANLERLLATMP